MEFCCCSKSTSDDEYSEHKIEEATIKIIEKIYDKILADCRLKVRKILYAIRYIAWLIVSDFEGLLGHEIAICKMGDVYAHNWSETHSCDNLEGVLANVQTQSGQDLSPVNGPRWNIDSKQHNRDQSVVEIVGFSWRICAKEGQDWCFTQRTK